jgi:hypothetical protein
MEQSDSTGRQTRSDKASGVSARNRFIILVVALLALLPAPRAAAQLEETTALVGALSDFAEFADDKGLVAAPHVAQELAATATKLKGVALSLSFLGAGLDVLFLFLPAGPSDTDIILDRLDTIETKIDAVTANLQRGFREIAERDEYIRLVDSFRDSEREIAAAYADWIDHQRAVKQNLPSDLNFSNTDMVFSHHAVFLASHCKDENKAQAPQVFDIINRQSFGNYALLASWGGVVFEKLLQAQIVATAMKTQQNLRKAEEVAEKSRRGEGLKEEERPWLGLTGDPLTKKAAGDAALEVSRTYEPLWTKCQGAYDAAMASATSIEAIKKNASDYIDHMISTSGMDIFNKGMNARDTTYKLFDENGVPAESVGFALAIGEALERNYEGMGWIVAVFAVSDQAWDFVLGNPRAQCVKRDRLPVAWQGAPDQQFLVSDDNEARTISRYNAPVGPIQRVEEERYVPVCVRPFPRTGTYTDRYLVNLIAHFFPAEALGTQEKTIERLIVTPGIQATTSLLQAVYPSLGTASDLVPFYGSIKPAGFLLVLRGGVAAGRDGAGLQPVQWGGFDIMSLYPSKFEFKPTDYVATNGFARKNLHYVYLNRENCVDADWQGNWKTGFDRNNLSERLNLTLNTDGLFTADYGNYKFAGRTDPVDRCVLRIDWTHRGSSRGRIRLLMAKKGQRIQGTWTSGTDDPAKKLTPIWLGSR